MKKQPKDIKQQITSKQFLKEYVPMYRYNKPFFCKKIPAYPFKMLTLSSVHETVCMKHCLN